jgi:hypothetical protein
MVVLLGFIIVVNESLTTAAAPEVSFLALVGIICTITVEHFLCMTIPQKTMGKYYELPNNWKNFFYNVLKAMINVPTDFLL